MPLLNKKFFERCRTPPDIDPDALVFYLDATGEVFLDHGDYFNRMVELNSTVWSCAYTRKTNLTFYEAQESENEAMKSLQYFPDFLEKPILYIVKHYTNRGRFEDLVNDIYFLMKDRYFISEEVVYTEKSRKFPSKVVGSFVLFPDDIFLQPFEVNGEMRDPSLPPAENYRYTIQVLDGLPFGDDGLREGVPPDKLFRSKNIGARQKVKLFLKNSCYMPWPGDHYTVKDEYLTDGIINNLRWQLIMAGAEPIFPHTPVIQRGRTPNVMKPGYTEPEKKVRERKEKSDPEAPPRPRGRPPKPDEERKRRQKRPKSENTENGVEKKKRRRKTIGVASASKDETTEESINKTPQKKILNGTIKTSEETPSKKAKLNAPKMSEKKRLKIVQQQHQLEFLFGEAARFDISIEGLKQDQKILSDKVVEEFTKSVKEAKEKEREQLKEERKRKAKEKAIYMKKREDLICDDLKPLPRFPKLELPAWLSPDEFADYIFVLQFFSSFKDILPLKEIRGSTDVYFSDIVIAMKCHDPQNSPYADLMRVLLSVRTDIADEEDGDEADITNKDELMLINSQNCDPVNPVYGESIRESCEEHSRIRKIHGKSVRHLPVDWMTLSEVLRLIFTTSGYYTGSSTHRHRLYTRGNFKGFEDPGFGFRYENAEVMEKLNTQTVFDLEPNERCAIMTTIIMQLLLYAKFRTHIEARQNEMYELKKENKKLKVWDQTQEQEAHSARIVLEQELEKGNVSPKVTTPLGKKLKAHLKAVNEGRRLDRQELDAILLETVPYSELDLDEILTARSLQKDEYNKIMKEVIAKIFNIYSNVSDIQLGKDRAYRKYFVLDNLAAILVENPSDFDRIDYCEEASIVENEQYLVEDDNNQVLICSGNVETCKVHGLLRNKRPRWSYIRGVDQFEELMKSLNPRGFRENALIEEINEYKPSLHEILEITKTSLENGDWEEMFMTNAADPGDTYNIDWDTELRDLMLDLEEKLNQGQMGSVSSVFSVDRASWRNSLKEFGDTISLLNKNIVVGNETLVDLEDTIERSDVKKLAICLLQIVKSIHPKFIKAPFTSVGKDENGSNVAKVSEMFVRWQKALIECESHSALSLFFSTLEPAIRWDKSRLQGKCRQCRKKGATSELVLCMECNNCYHLTCVKLATEESAPNDWLCATCNAQKRKVENEARRRARVALEDSEEELKLGSLQLEDSQSTLFATPTESQTSFADMSLSHSGAMILTGKTRTSSGRTVRKIDYNYIDSPTKKQTKPRRSGKGCFSDHTSKSMRDSDDYDENTSVDESDTMYIDEERRKSSRKKTPKRRLSQTFEPARNTIQNNREKMSLLEKILKDAMHQECSWPFLKPVDKREVPDYYNVIKRPMDLHTMMNKIKQRIYNKPEEFRNDFKLIIKNCETYNETESEIYEASQQLLEFVTPKMNSIIDN